MAEKDRSPARPAMLPDSGRPPGPNGVIDPEMEAAGGVRLQERGGRAGANNSIRLPSAADHPAHGRAWKPTVRSVEEARSARQAEPAVRTHSFAWRDLQQAFGQTAALRLANTRASRLTNKCPNE